MIKRISIYALRRGVDREKFWEYHKKIHAIDVLRVAGPRLKKYVINRVISTYLATAVEQKTDVFDIVETYWENEEIMNQSYKELGEAKVASGKNVVEDFLSQASLDMAVTVEEFVVKDIT